jgi:hypothetical protein
VVLVAKFAAGVADTGGEPSLANISENIQKNCNDPDVIFSCLGEDYS